MKFIALAVFLFYLHLAQASEENEDQDPYMYSESNFDELISTEAHFIMFFAPWWDGA